MSIEICDIETIRGASWDAFVTKHPAGTLYHLAGWREVIEKTYRHPTHYLAARDLKSGKVTGILPLVHLKHFIFGNGLLSMPFFDMGGILANDLETETALLNKAMELGRSLKANHIELRNSPSALDETIQVTVKSHKVRMILDLPESSEALMKSFKSKLRSQIKRPMKEGLIVKVGDSELLDDFYKVFVVNMRDLGSPVHSKKLMANVLQIFSDSAKVFIVYLKDRPVSCSLTVGFKDILENPWASSLRQYSKFSPNMLLYWSMLEYACENNYKRFDFGRSSPDEGTYKFKAQWGAKPEPLHWLYVWLRGEPDTAELSEKSTFGFASRCWQKLPVPATKVMGPIIRKHIGL